MTDEERREVAARLRNQADRMAKNREWYDGNRTYRSIADSVERYSNIGAHYEETVRKLADLIDRPTCRNDSEFGSHTVAVANSIRDECFDFVCSRCGLHLSGDEMDNSPLMDEELGHRALRYCPSCGAEVVK